MPSVAREGSPRKAFDFVQVAASGYTSPGTSNSARATPATGLHTPRPDERVQIRPSPPALASASSNQPAAAARAGSISIRDAIGEDLREP